MSEATKICLSDFTLDALTAYLVSLGQPKFRAKQIFKWLHQKLVTEFSQMTDQPKALLAQLEEQCTIAAPALRRRQQRLEGHRHRHKGDEAQAVQRHIGTKSAYDLLAQGNAPPSRRGYYSILRVVYYSTKAVRGQYAFREISGEFSRRGGGCQIPSNAVGKLGVYKWEKLWYTL